MPAARRSLPAARRSHPASSPAALAVLAALLAAPSVAAAQVVNAESFAAGAREEGVGLRATASTALAAGNASYFDLRGELAAQYLTLYDDPEGGPRWFRDRLLLNARGALKTAGGETIVDERLVHLRYTRMATRRVGGEGFGQVQNDASLLLEWRVLGGAGLRVVAVNAPHVGLWGGTGYMAEYEVLDVPADGPDAPTALNHRSTTYVAWRWDVVPGHLAWTNTAYVQPRFDDPADVQLLDESALSVAVTGALSFTTGVRVRYDSRPVADLVAYDVRWTTGLTLQLAARPDAASPG